MSEGENTDLKPAYRQAGLKEQLILFDMKLHNLLSEKRSAILNKWYDEVLDTYPSNSSGFLKEQKNPFLNPVGSTIFKGIENLFDELLKEELSDKASLFLDDTIRIRAVQDFSPSQAIAFILLLKKVIREELGNEILKNGISEELLSLESRIDKLALLSFDIYMKCKEKIYEIKSNEVRNMTFRLLQRANLIGEGTEQESDIDSAALLTQEE